MNSVNPSSKKLLNAFVQAIKGIGFAVKSERNLRFHFIAVGSVVLLGFITNISGVEWVLILTLFGLVISMEMINTAIEKLCDVVQPEKDDRIRMIKDISAGAVLWTSLISLIAGLLIFIPKFFNNFI
jgi:diacylglycerol kinase (ATP)